MKQQGRTQPPIPPQEANSVMAADSAVRNNLAELVKALMSQGKIDQLEGLLKEHQTFINDILTMIEQSRKGKS
ncbi:MAG: hypothetical protein OEZ34_03495 [Spirochaetia bacterium]|nr:hypothetical protein [Spirochaetia bacterium]